MCYKSAPRSLHQEVCTKEPVSRSQYPEPSIRIHKAGLWIERGDEDGREGGRDAGVELTEERGESG